MDKIKIENLTSSDNDSDSEDVGVISTLPYPTTGGIIRYIPSTPPGVVEENVPSSSAYRSYRILGPRGGNPIVCKMLPKQNSSSKTPQLNFFEPKGTGNAPPILYIANKPAPKPNTESYTPTPISTAQLVVSKPKVKQLESWMKAALATKKPSILLLTGPTGCGKTAAVLAVAADLGARVIEWITPMDEFQDVNQNHLQTSNQATKFLDFILAGSRYQPVIGPSNPRKMILVEDYPNTFLRTPSLFHDTVMKYCEKGLCPLVFITTDGKRKISLDLFPEKLMKSAFIHHICINAVADTFMKHAIDLMATRQNRCDVDPMTRKAICAAAMGDVRSAENIWNFQYRGTTKPASIAVPGTSSGVKRKGATMTLPATLPPKKALGPCFDSKDPGYEKLHCIGRVLYAKRETAPVESGSPDEDPRGYLRTDPNTIVSQFLSERHSFVALAHENYPAIFSSIEQVAEAAENLSFADIIAPENRLDLENLGENSFSIAIRGLMNACTNPITKWFPLKKSRFREVEDTYEKFMQKVTLQYAGSPYSLTTAKVDMIPMLHNLEKIHPYDKTETGRHSPIPHITDDSDEDV